MRCAVDLQTKAGKQIRKAKRTFSGIGEMNDDRQVVVHSAFGPAEPDGVQFRRRVAKGKLKSEALLWSEKELEQRFKKLQRLETSLKQIIVELEPEQIKWPPTANVAPLPAHLSPAFFWEHTPLPLREIGKGSR
jgi:hypothetical protein